MGKGSFINPEQRSGIRAKVEVVGSYSYDTQTGGNTTVPSFSVQSIERIGSNS